MESQQRALMHRLERSPSPPSKRTLWLLHDEYRAARAEQGEPAGATAGISPTCRQADRSSNKMRSCYAISLLTNMNWHPQPAYISTLWTHYAVRCLTSYFLNKCWWGGPTVVKRLIILLGSGPLSTTTDHVEMNLLWVQILHCGFNT